MQKKHSNRLLRSIEYASVVLLCTTLLGLMGCGDDTPLSSEKLISGFSINGVSATITENTKTITMDLGVSAKLDILIPVITISDKASVSPRSGVAQDFTNGVVYTVTAEDGSSQDYRVLVKGVEKSTAKAITALSINGVAGTPQADNDKIIVVTLPKETTDITRLSPTFSIPPLASVSPLSGIQQDFTNAVVYTVTAEDGSIQDYTVIVNVTAKSNAKDMTALDIPGGTVTPVGTTNTWLVTMPHTTPSYSLVPNFTIPAGASASPASGVQQDFTNPVTYTVTAEDGSTKQYIVGVVIEDPRTGLSIDLAGTNKQITVYSTPALAPYGTAGVSDTVRLSLSGRSNGTNTAAGTVANNKEAVVSIKVAGAADNNWSVTSWRVDGLGVSQINGTNTNIITLKAANYFIGRHSVTFTVSVNGQPYSEQFYFVVDK